jgi:hypothetical protein
VNGMPGRAVRDGARALESRKAEAGTEAPERSYCCPARGRLACEAG